jgi:hypothetical protein
MGGVSALSDSPGSHLKNGRRARRSFDARLSRFASAALDKFAGSEFGRPKVAHGSWRNCREHAFMNDKTYEAGLLYRVHATERVHGFCCTPGWKHCLPSDRSQDYLMVGEAQPCKYPAGVYEAASGNYAF